MLRHCEYLTVNFHKLIGEFISDGHELLNHSVFELRQDVLHPDAVIALLLNEAGILLHFRLDGSNVGRVLLDPGLRLSHFLCSIVADILTKFFLIDSKKD